MTGNVLKMGNKTANRCNGLDCEEISLCDAHIIPQGFARITRGSDHNVILTNQKRRTTPQLGEIDSYILCAACDGALGVFDKALIEAASNFRRVHRNNGTKWSLPTVSPDAFAKGVFAIFWRASLSQRPDFRNFTLGKAQDDVRDILFGRATFADKPYLSLFVQRYKSKRFDVSRVFSDPSLAPFMDRQAAWLSLTGFRFMALFDGIEVDQKSSSRDLTRCGLIHGDYITIEDTLEFKVMSRMMVADMLRAKDKAG